MFKLPEWWSDTENGFGNERKTCFPTFTEISSICDFMSTPGRQQATQFVHQVAH